MICLHTLCFFCCCWFFFRKCFFLEKYQKGLMDFFNPSLSWVIFFKLYVFHGSCHFYVLNWEFKEVIQHGSYSFGEPFMCVLLYWTTKPWHLVFVKNIVLNEIRVHLYFLCRNLNYGSLRRIEIFLTNKRT